MRVPNLPRGPIADQNGFLSDEWKSYFEQLQINMIKAIGTEGYQIPQVSSTVTSSNPLSPLQQIAQNVDSFGTHTCIPGTVVFDPAEVNGGTSMAPKGQLKVFLNDNTFHNITNT